MRDKARFYYDGSEFVPSGTTVLPKPYLAKWAANCAVDYLQVTQMSGQYSFLPEPEKRYWLNADENMANARTAFERESTQAADYGTYIHTVCQYSLENDLELESPHVMTDKFMKGLWKWKVKHNVKVIAMEQEVIGYKYGGRLDLVCELDGVVTLVDFKTGKGSYYENWKYQLAGYRQAYNLSIPIEVSVSAGGGISAFVPEPNGLIQTHGILKFNKETMKVNYKDFNEYQTTRTNPKTKEKEKYTRTYETDKATFNGFVASWWLTERGIKI